jgi:WD40 repeat protein/serine/threonine protein kinase
MVSGAIASVADLVAALRRTALLSQDRLGQIIELTRRYPQPRELAGELIRRDWLTPYQINQLFQGKGADLVLGSYILLERLGEGGMGAVFKSRHQKLGNVVALKVIRKEQVRNPDSVRRFLREIQTVAQLDHPNIVRATDADQIGDTLVLVMEYVEGTDLYRLVKKQGPLPVQLACEYVRQAALGLQYVHEHNLVHRDIKPHNLFLTAGGQVKILDMGLARLTQFGEESDSNSGLTPEGMVVGTPDYIAPEQTLNAASTNICSDLYSLGCTLYFLLSGQVPFPGNSLGEKIARHLSQEPPRVDRLRPEVPASVVAVVNTLLAKRPEQRYQTPAELAAVLLRVQGSRPIRLPPATGQPLQAPQVATEISSTVTDLPGATHLPAQRRRRVVLGGVLLAAMIGASLGMYFAWRDEKKPEGNTSPLGRLDRDSLPAAERFAWHPPELVAVIGEQRQRHWAAVTSVAFDPEGRWFASGSQDRSVRLWDTDTGAERGVLTGHAEGVLALAVTPDGKTIASAGADRTVRLWTVGANRATPRVTLNRHTGRVHALAFAAPTARHPSGWLASAGTDQTILLWNLAGVERTPPTVLKGHTGSINALVFVSDRLLVSGGADNSVRLWDLTGVGAPPSIVLEGHQSTVTSLALSSDQTGQGLLASGGSDGAIYLWDLDGTRGTERMHWRDPAGAVTALALSTDRQRLFVAGGGTEVRIWNLSTGVPKVTGHLEGHERLISSLALSADNRLLATGSVDRAVRLWDVAGSEPGELRPLGAAVQHGLALAFAPAGRALVEVADDQSIRLWDLTATQPREQASRKANAREMAVLAYPANATAVLCAGDDWTLLRWAPSDPGPTKPLVLRESNNRVTCLALASHGNALAVAGPDLLLRLWDLSGETPREKGSLEKDLPPVTALAFTDDGTQLAAGFQDRTLRLWDLRGSTPVARALPRSHLGSVTALAFAANGKSLASGDKQGTVHVWKLDAAKPTSQATIKSRESPVTALAFTPDGQTLAIATDGRLLFWNLQAFHEGPSWSLPGAVHHLAFTPDGDHIALACSNGTIAILRRPH